MGEGSKEPDAGSETAADCFWLLSRAYLPRFFLAVFFWEPAAGLGFFWMNRKSARFALSGGSLEFRFLGRLAIGEV